MKHRVALPIAAAFLVAAGSLTRAGDKVLYEKPSQYNTIVVTESDNGVRTLWFQKNGARQSVVKPGDPDYLELPYARAMLSSLAFCERAERVLIIGLGGGTLPAFLHKHYPAMGIDVVDIDPDVVEVARKFFNLAEDATLRVHVADGRRFVEESREPYDIIMLDAYGPDSIPSHLATLEFLKAARRALSPTGIVAGNLWSRYTNPLYDAMVRTYQEAFEELHVVEARGSGNHILIGLPAKLDLRVEAVTQRATQISNQGNFGFDMGAVITDGHRYAREKSPDAQVLRDKAE